MHTDEVFVIYNTFNQTISRVFAEEFLAKRYYDWLIGPAGPITGTVNNADKYIMCTLDKALREIDLHYVSEMEGLK